VLTVPGLPASGTRRWSARRKGEIVAAVEGGLLSTEEACSIYELSMDEFLSWKSAVAQHGLAGLRARHPRQTERGQAQHERRSFSALNVGRWGSRMEPEQSMTSATNEIESGHEPGLAGSNQCKSPGPALPQACEAGQNGRRQPPALSYPCCSRGCGYEPRSFLGSEHDAAERRGSPFLTLHREMNRLFDDVFNRFDSGMPSFVGRASAWSGSFWPSIEVNATDNEIRVSAELPGMDEKDVELLINEGVLTIRGEKKVGAKDRGRRFSEHHYGRFERSIALRFELKEDRAEASFKNGVLTVVLPKSAKARESAKRIAINSKKDTQH
jgi:HSP20 family protein